MLIRGALIKMAVKLTLRMWILIIALILALLMISPSFKTGVVIKSVERNSTAFESGLQQGMIIKSINEETIGSMEDYTNVVTSLIERNETRVSIWTDEEEFILFNEGVSKITVGEIPRTRIRTGLDLSGGARALVEASNVTLTTQQLSELVDLTSQRLNAFGISDVNIKPVNDLSGNKFMLIEIAGATPADLENLVGQQGKFEARIGNETVFVGGTGEDKDIADVCRNDATCADVRSCSYTGADYVCRFDFVVYLTQKAAEKHANVTSRLGIDESGQYLSEKLYLYIDDQEVDSLFISVGLKGQRTTEILIQGSGVGATQEDALKDAKANMKKLQTILLTGSIPYKLDIVKLDTISPTLGHEFARSIMLLGLVVFVAVSVAIFVKYRNIKITSAVILTMFAEAFLTVAIAAMFRWNLDAPSIAGIIAGIGIGVNDQIIILDESASGGDRVEGVKERVKRALFIIIGAFFTIIAAMIPLFLAGAGMLKGFAFTTIVGVTMGILITRPAFADIISRIKSK